MTDDEEIEELNRLYLVEQADVAQRPPLWKRIWWPTSNWPTRYTRTCGWWHLYWHLGALRARLYIRWLAWRGY